MSWSLVPASQFQRFQNEWRALNERGLKSPLLDPDFIEPLLAHFGDGHERLAIYGQPQPKAMTLLKQPRRGVWETFKPSQAPVALWVAESPLSWESTLPKLQRALPACLLLGINQVDPDHFTRPRETARLVTLDYINTARITVNQSFEHYWMRRGKNLRHNLKRQRNRLSDAGMTPLLETISAPAGIVNAVRDYGRLESSGWKTASGTAVSPDNAQGRFYAEMLERFARRGAARVYRYWFGDRLVAIDLCLVSRSALIILKTTYEESEKTSSPALLMREEAFQKLHDEKTVERIEFYGKVMEWHTKWSDEFRTLYHINYYRFGWLRHMHRARKSPAVRESKLEK